LDVYYVDFYEAKASLLSVVPQVLGRCAPRFSFPLSSSPLLPFSLQVTLELWSSLSELIQDLLEAYSHPLLYLIFH